MKRVLRLACCCALLSSAALLYAGQNPALKASAPAAATYRPGDTVWIDVSFAQPASVNHADLFFELLGQPPRDQQGLEFRFGGKSGELQKVSATEYRIGEKIPRGIASGKYRLYRVQVGVDDALRGYEFNSAFHSQVVIRVANQQVTAPPKIQSLRLIPGKK